MKKIKLFWITLLSVVLFYPTVKAYDNSWLEIGDGNSYPESSSTECMDSKACHCRYNNKKYGALKFSIVYYDGNYRHLLGKPVAYYNSPVGKYPWIEDRFEGIIYKKWLPWVNINDSKSQDIEEKLIGGDQKSKKYPIIKEIFKDTGVNYDQLLAAVNSNGSYTDGGKTYNNMVNEKIGSKGVSTKGVRVIVEPIVSLQSNGICNSYRESTKIFTVKELFKVYYGKTDKGINGGVYDVLNEPTYENFSKLLWLDRADAGYNKASTNVVLSQVSSSTSGWGLNIYAPFDDVAVEICDPDAEYDGYDSGVEYCCKREGITPEDKSNNKTKEEGGFLKRALTDEEINLKCPKEGEGKCDPKIDGADECCVKCEVSVGHLENNKESECMTGPIDLTELENSICNKNTTNPPGTPPGTPPGKQCEYAFDMDVPENCDKKNTGKIKDIASWECTFNSSNNKDVKDHYFDGADNDYCAIYCKEEVNSLLPDAGLKITQGRYLILGNVTTDLPNVSSIMEPISYKGKKTCRVTSAKGSTTGKIDKEKFEKDMEEADQKIKKYWDEWKILEAKQKACSNGSGSYDGKYYTCELDNNGKKPNYSTKIAEAKKNYENAEKDREKHIKQINACTEFAENRDYKFEPSVDFEYKEPTYGFNSDGSVKSWTLDILENSKTDTIKYSKTGTANDKNINGTENIEYIEKTMYKCSGEEPCKKDDKYKYPDVLWWETVKDVEIEYGLPENTYRYISKSTARSFDSKEDAGVVNSVDMGVANLPIHVSTLPGYYDYKFTTNSFGDGNKFTPYVFNSKPFNKVDYSQIKDYSCKFEIICEPTIMTPEYENYCRICGKSIKCKNTGIPPGTPPGTPPDITDPPGKGGVPTPGVDLIFRPISLYDKIQAFPGINGQGRTPGSNWNDTQIDIFIVNSRESKAYEIYDKSPMYEITLTPSLMKEIRKYNKEKNSKLITIYDGPTQSTGVAGYGDYDSMTCLGNGTTCVSSKLRDWEVHGCGIQDDKFSNYNNCATNTDKQWGLN